MRLGEISHEVGQTLLRKNIASLNPRVIILIVPLILMSGMLPSQPPPITCGAGADDSRTGLFSTFTFMSGAKIVSGSSRTGIIS